jgi:hypothetical protein
MDRWQVKRYPYARLTSNAKHCCVLNLKTRMMYSIPSEVMGNAPESQPPQHEGGEVEVVP